MLFELFDDVDVFVGSHEEFNHDLVTVGIVDLALAQPVVSVVFQEVFEDLTVVSVLDKETDGVVIELLRADVSLEFFTHFFDGVGFGLGVVVDREDIVSFEDNIDVITIAAGNILLEVRNFGGFGVGVSSDSAGAQ